MLVVVIFSCRNNDGFSGAAARWICTHIILNVAILVINPESHLLEIKLGSDDLDFKGSI